MAASKKGQRKVAKRAGGGAKVKAAHGGGMKSSRAKALRARPPRQATIYRVKDVAAGGPAIVLTRGSKRRKPDATLKGQKVDIQGGAFWVTDLPDWFFDNNYEALLEITATSPATVGGTDTELSYPFKLQSKVADDTFSDLVQDNELLSGILVGPTGFKLRIVLTEVDKVDEVKVGLIEKFLQESKLGDLANKVAPIPGLPAAEIIGTLFKTVRLLDALNEDDIVWRENPKMDLRDDSESPLYQGWYAMVMTPDDGKPLPMDLFLSGGELFTEFTDDTNNKPFRAQTYLTWNVLRQ